MLTLLSPAKSLDYESPLLTERSTQPRLKEDTAVLIDQLKGFSCKEIGALMSVSDKLASLNHERFQSFASSFTKKNSRQAILAFTGDVYQGMTLDDWSADDFATAQNKIRILSGLYGVLRPLDMIQPYRLEMGTNLKNKRGKNLYQFWGDTITGLLNKDLMKSKSDIVVNLASNEYFSAIDSSKLDGTLVSPVFKDEKNSAYKIISFYAKKARGMMADFVVKNDLTKAEDLLGFKAAGYTYDADSSSKNQPVFLRSEDALMAS
ncbi:MAG TPA: peroxide stress protein YaaA [Opitutae bacterium]|nr:peroxide stress protein YaaA [Opitutae bacterium]